MDDSSLLADGRPCSSVWRALDDEESDLIREANPMIRGPVLDFTTVMSTVLDLSDTSMRPWMVERIDDDKCTDDEKPLVLAGSCLSSYFRCIALAGAPRPNVDGTDRRRALWFIVWPWVVAAWCALGCVCFGLGFVYHSPRPGPSSDSSNSANDASIDNPFGALMGAMFLCYSPAMNCAQVHACRTDMVALDGTGALEKLAAMPITAKAVKLLKATQPMVDFNANMFFVPYWLLLYAAYYLEVSRVSPLVFVGAAFGCLAWGNVVQSGIGVAGAASIIISDQVQQFNELVKSINPDGAKASAAASLSRTISVFEQENFELRVRIMWLVREVIPLYERGWSVVGLTRMLEMLFGSVIVWSALVHNQLGDSFFFKAGAFGLSCMFSGMAAYTIYIPMQVTIDTQILLKELNGLMARVSFDDARQIDLQLFQFLKRSNGLSNGRHSGPGVMFFGARITPRLLVQFIATIVSGLVSVGGYTVDDAVGKLEAV